MIDSYSKSKLEEEIDPNNPDFVDNFNRLIEDSHNRWLEKLKINPDYPNEESEDNTKSKTKVTKKKKMMENIFRDPPSWKPPFNYGSEFDKFKRLRHEKQMNGWEIMRNNMVKRSYFKEALELPKGKPYYGTQKLTGGEFGEKQVPLSESGEKILQKFIKENNMKKTHLKNIEEEIYKYKHSKPAVDLNPWKYSNTNGKEFSIPMADKIHSFNRPLKDTRVKKPFYRPSDYGDYFNKIDLSCEYEKFAQS